MLIRRGGAGGRHERKASEAKALTRRPARSHKGGGRMVSAAAGGWDVRWGRVWFKWEKQSGRWRGGVVVQTER